MNRRRVLITNGMSNDSIIISTNAPKSSIIAWCFKYNEEMENGENTYFDSLKEEYNVDVLYDSEDGESEDIDAIGYDEVYDLSNYM